MGKIPVHLDEEYARNSVFGNRIVYGQSCHWMLAEPYTIVGPNSTAAAGAVVMKNIKPFSRYIPNKPFSMNTYAIKKYGFEEYTDEITDYFLNDVNPTSEKIRTIIDEFDHWVQKYGHETYK